MTVGSNIKFARKFYKLTQKELADKIGKNLSTIKKYESDQINIPYQVLDDISDVFEIDIETLVGSQSSLETCLIVTNENKKVPNELLIQENKDLYIKSEGLSNETINLVKSILKKSELKSYFDTIIEYANNDNPVDFTEKEREKLFDEVVDYIRYKLYSIGK